jgi:hypothetical protein
LAIVPAQISATIHQRKCGIRFTILSPTRGVVRWHAA